MTWLSKIRLWEIAFAVFIGFVSYFVWTTVQESHQVTDKTVAVLDHADKSLTNLDNNISTIGNSVGQVASGLITNENQLTVALNKVNQLCIPVKGQIATLADSKNCGTLADFSRTLQTLRGTIGTVETAGFNFDQHEGELFTQESTLFTHTDNLIASFAPVPGHIDKTITDIDGFTSSPDVLGTVKHFNTITGNFGDMSTTANIKFQAFMYPPPCPKGFKAGFKCHLGETLKELQTASQFSEPAYWTWALISGIHP